MSVWVKERVTAMAALLRDRALRSTVQQIHPMFLLALLSALLALSVFVVLLVFVDLIQLNRSHTGELTSSRG